MATIGDNVLELAMLVKDVKRKTQLSEATIMRVVDMTFALAQQNQSPTFGTPEDTDFLNDPEGFNIPEGEVIEFPTPEPTEEV